MERNSRWVTSIVDRKGGREVVKTGKWSTMVKLGLAKSQKFVGFVLLIMNIHPIRFQTHVSHFYLVLMDVDGGIQKDLKVFDLFFPLHVSLACLETYYASCD